MISEICKIPLAESDYIVEGTLHERANKPSQFRARSRARSHAEWTNPKADIPSTSREFVPARIAGCAERRARDRRSRCSPDQPQRHSAALFSSRPVRQFQFDRTDVSRDAAPSRQLGGYPSMDVSLARSRCFLLSRPTERRKERARERCVTTPGVTAAEMYGNCTRLTYRDSAACGRREYLPVVSLAQHPPADTRRKLARKPTRVNSIPAPRPPRALLPFLPLGGGGRRGRWMQPTPGDVGRKFDRLLSRRSRARVSFLLFSLRSSALPLASALGEEPRESAFPEVALGPLSFFERP